MVPLGEPLKELKIKLPVKQASRLYAMKILQSRSMSEIVAEALDLHLAALEAGRAAAATA